MRQCVKLERRHGFPEARPGPKGERTAQRQLAVERQAFIGQRDIGSLNPPRVRLEQAGDQPEQARFAAAVGTPNVQRFTAVKMKVKPLEQQPPASDKRKIFGVEQLHA
jgi:hypothetical protein